MGGGGGGGEQPVGPTDAELASQERQRQLDREEAQRQREFDAQRADQIRAEERAMFDRQTQLQEQTSARTRQQQLDDAAAARAESEAARVREETRAATELAQRRTRFDTSVNEGTERSRTRAVTELGRYGVDASPYLDRINAAITDQRNAVPDLADNAGSYFNGDFVTGLLDVAQTDRRRQYRGEVDTRFGTGFERNIYADTADDPFIESVIGDQYGQAAQAVERARLRGNLDETGVAAALGELARMRTAGTATAQTLGGTVLENNRGRLRSVADRAREAATGFNLGDNFDLGVYGNEVDSLRTGMDANLEGEVRNALNGQQFFDVDSVLNRGGANQGGVNPTGPVSSSLAEQIAERERRRQADRGIGGGGSF